MCGICGILNFNEHDIDADLLRNMCDSLSHRGPDDSGVYLESPYIGLGHRRLSIIDLATGHQPMSNEDKSVWIAFNGEIYNYKKLQHDLKQKGHVFTTESDTETIIHLYEEMGIDCIHELEGMFAIALWDENTKQLFLIRDRIGIKPLYYSIINDQLIFASEIRALLEHPDVERDIDEESLYHYMSFRTAPPPKTLFKNINKLEAGHYLVCNLTGNTSIHQYWDVDSIKVDNTKSEEYYISKIRELLAGSIEKRMQSDVPFGVFLSGGIDSSTIVALMSKVMDRPVDTFSVGFAGSPEYNEMKYARQIAEQFNTNHHEVVIDFNDFVRYLPQLIHSQDEPISDHVCVPLFYVSDLLRKHGVIVTLVGEGSDEQFCGYGHYLKYLKIYKAWKIYERIPRALRKSIYNSTKFIFELLNNGDSIFLDFLRRGTYDQELFWGGSIVFWELQKQKLFSEKVRRKYKGLSSYNIVNKYLSKIKGSNIYSDFLSRMIYLEFKIRLPELLLMRVDKITMSTSNEARVPFLDHKFVELSRAIPSKLKTKGGETKYILKKAVEGLIPDNIIYRKKQGFNAPIEEWFSNELSGLLSDVLLRSSIRKRDLFDYDYIEKIIDRFKTDKDSKVYREYMWVLFNLFLWYDYWIEQEDIEQKYKLTSYMKNTEHL